MSEMTAGTLRFLPWIRSGIGVQLTDTDTGQTDQPRGAPVGAFVEIDGDRAEATLSLRPADHAIAIDEGQIVRRYPATGTTDAEYGYFPHIELAAPGLPWVLSPSRADEDPGDADASTGRLRPWLVLVCLEDSLADLRPGSAATPTTLVAPIDELPDLVESWAWAHVQSSVRFQETADASTAADGRVISRLVCPRILEADRTYRAALVRAWESNEDGDRLVPAWSGNSGTSAPLTVYTTWTFTTGDAGSFEELCERLGPIDDPDFVLGVNPMDMTELGTIDPWTHPDAVVVDYTGALLDSSVTPRGLGKDKADFDLALADVLDKGDHRVTVRLNQPDPVVTPPLYGSFAAGKHEVPKAGWLRGLNLVPRRRVAAGLGARLVRIHQERFMAAAWDQAGQLREVNRALNVSRLQSEVGRTWRARANRLDPLQHVTVLRAQYGFIRMEDGRAPRRALAASTIPDALVSPLYQRAIRPGGVVSATAGPIRRPQPPRGVETEPPRRPRWQQHVGTQFGHSEFREDTNFGKVRRPDGMATAHPDRVRPSGDGRPPPIDGATPYLPWSDDLELDDVTATGAVEIRPMAAGRARMEQRVPILSDLLAEQPSWALPTRVMWGPELREALSWSLLDLSASLFMPGIEEFPDNAVRVVEEDSGFVAGLLAGANHEMTRELLWREFPCSLGWTSFRRFWDRPDGSPDIDPMDGWPLNRSLEYHAGAANQSVVLLIRGDLIRQYPAVRILLLAPDEDVAMEPTFSGWLPPDVRFVGFDVDSVEAVTQPATPDDEYQVIIEELPSEPRFGLDTVDGTPPPLTGFDELSWQHLRYQPAGATHLAVAAEEWLADVTALGAEAQWGLNSAHLARATFQRPFRRVFDVTDLIG